MLGGAFVAHCLLQRQAVRGSERRTIIQPHPLFAETAADPCRSNAAARRRVSLRFMGHLTVSQSGNCFPTAPMGDIQAPSGMTVRARHRSLRETDRRELYARTPCELNKPQ